MKKKKEHFYININLRRLSVVKQRSAVTQRLYLKSNVSIQECKIYFSKRPAFRITPKAPGLKLLVMLNGPIYYYMTTRQSCLLLR